MGQTVKLRRSAVGGKKPLNSQLELGELSVNTTDGKLYFAKSGSQGPSVEEIITTNAKNTGSLDIVGSITASNFTGSFTGDGSGLYNISVSGVTGLSLDKLTYGSSTASIDDRGLHVNVDTSITGSLTATEFTGSGLGLTNVPFRLSGSSAELTAYDDQYTKIHFDDSTGIKIEGDSSTGIARIYLDGVAAEGSGEGSTALLSVTSATSTWTFNHNLGEKYPAITVFDSNNNVIIPQNIEAVSTTQLVVSFASPQTGYVTATVGGGLPAISSSYGGRFLTVNSGGTAPEWSEVDFLTNGSFNTYTSSIGLRVDSLETESGSIRDDFNTITSSFGDRLRLLEGESGSIRVDFNSYTSSNNTLNVTQNGRLNSLETESGSIRTFFNAYTASNNTTNTVQNNRLSALETKSGSLDSDISTIEGRLDSIEIESGSIRSTFNSYTSSNNTRNSQQDGRLDSIESFTASIDDTYATDSDVSDLRGDFNTYTSSNNTTNSTQNGRLNSLETESGSIRSAFNTYTSSNNTTNTTQNSRLSSLETKTGSLDSDISTIEGRLDSIETTTSSLDGRVDSLETESASIRTTFNSYTSSNNTTNTTQNNRLTSLETTTASFDGRLDSLETTSASHDGRLDTIEGGLEFTGSNVTVKGNLLVKGTETRVNSTTVEISDNVISLNGSGASNGGIEVRDTTSPGLLSGSLLWDSTNNYWVGGTKGSEERLLDRRDLTSLSGDISTIDGRVDSLETESGSIRTAFNTYTSSNNTTNTTQNNRLTSLETKTGSLDDDISTIDGRLDSLETESGSIRTTFNSYTSSNNTTNTTQNSRLTSLESKTGSYLTSYTETQTLEDVATLGNATTLDLEARSFIVTGANGSQFLKGDGSLDSNTYLTSHPSVSAATSSNNSGRTYIQDILLDSFGHITGITTATETVVNTDTNNFTTGATFNTSDGVVTFTRNNGNTYTVDLDGRYLQSYTETDPIFTASDAFNIRTADITNWNTAFGWGDHSTRGYLTAHPSVSAATSSNNSGRTYIQDILLDSFGHITGITTASETVVDTYITGATFNTTSGVITFTKNNGGTVTVDIDGKYAESGHNHDADYVNVNGDTMTGNLKVRGNINIEDGDLIMDSGTVNGTNYRKIRFTEDIDSAAGFQGAYMHYNADDNLFQIGTHEASDTNTLNDVYHISMTRGTGNVTINNNITASSFIKRNGTSSQFLMADGSVSTNPGWLTAHPSVSAATSSNNSGRTYIQDILLDGFGHITGITTATETVVDTNNFTTGVTWNAGTATLRFTKNDGDSYDVQMLETLTDVTVTGGTYNSGTQTLRLTKSDGSTVDVSGFAIDTDVNWYITGLTFNTGTGVLTATRNDGGTSTVDLDGRYLTSYTETDTLATVTARGASTSTDITVQNVLINDGSAQGGTERYDAYKRLTFSNAHSDVARGPNKITMYDNGSTWIGGFGIHSGTVAYYSGDVHKWYKSNSQTSFTEVMSLSNGGNLTVLGTLTASGYNKTNWDTAYGWGNHASAGYLTAHPSVSAASSSNNSGRTYIQDILLDGFGHITGITTATETVVNTNNYVTGATFNTGNGIITLTKNDGTTVTVDIDGRFLTSYTETDTLQSVTDRGSITTNTVIFENGLRVGTGDHMTDGRASITFGEGTPTSDSMYIEYDGENLSGVNNAIIIGGGDTPTDYFKVTYGGNVIVSSPAGITHKSIELIPTGGDTAAFKAGYARFGTLDGGKYSDISMNSWWDGAKWIADDSASVGMLTRLQGTGALTSSAWRWYSAPAATNHSYIERMTLTGDGNLSVVGTITATGGNSTNWNTAYGWGNHASAGYLTAIPSSFSTNSITIGNAVTLSESTDRADLLSINSGTSGWGGLQITNTAGEGILSLMIDGSNGGLYDDQNGDWLLYYTENGSVELRYNSLTRLVTQSDGVDISGNLDVTGTLIAGNTFVNGLITGGFGSQTTDGTLDWNDSSNARSGQGYSLLLGNHSNGPTNTGQYFHPFSFEYSSKNGSGNLTQLAIPYTGYGLHYRSRYSDTWDGWISIWDTSHFSSTNISNWNTAYGWGNHASAGYLTAHPSVSAASSSNNSGRTYIQDILLDSFGHITGITTATETVVNTDTNNYVTGATFNTGNGIITLTKNDGTTVTVDIDGRFLTSYTETDTLASVTARGASTATASTFTGGLYGRGTQDKISDITIHRLNSGNEVDIDTLDSFILSKTDGSYGSGTKPSGSHNGFGVISLQTHATGYFTQLGLDTNQNKLWIRSANGNGSYGTWYSTWSTQDFSSSNVSNWNTAYGWGNHASAGYKTTDYFTTGATFNSGTGIVTFTRNDGNTYTLNIASTLTDVTVTGGTYNSGTQTLRLTKSDGNTVDVSGFAIDTDVNWYTTGATFNTGNGIITGTHQGGTWTVDIDGRYLELGGGTLTGDLIVGSTSTASNRVVRALSNDDHRSGFEAYGNSQGNGYLYVGQSSTYGGGISYNGDGSPAFIGGETSDYITFYRREAGVDTEVFAFPYSNNNVYFNGEVHAGGGNSSQWNTAVSWGDHAGLYLGINSKAADSELLDGINSSSFFRNDVEAQDISGYVRINKNWGGGTYGAESFTIRGTYPSIALRSSNADFKWLLHTDASGNFRWYTGPTYDDNAWTNRFTFGVDNNFYIDSGHIYTQTGNSTQWNTAYGWGNHASAGYLTSYTETDTLATVTSRGSTMSAVLYSTRNTASGLSNLGFSTAKTVIGNIHIQNGGGPSNDNSNQAAITFQGSDASQSQAGIYVLNNGSYGTSMGFAVTENYSTGPQIFMTSSNNGIVNFVRQRPTVSGNGIWHAGDFTSTNITNWNTAYGWGNHASAGYLTSYAETDTLATVTARGSSTSSNVAFNGYLHASSSSKLVIQGSTDGGSSKGIWMWSNTDSNWGIYMGTAGASKSLAGATAVGSIDGQTSHHIRFRVANSTGNGFIWENHVEQALMSLNGNNGNLFTRGSIYPSNQVTHYVDSTRIQNWQTAYGWGNHSGLYLGINSKAADSNLLDGLDLHTGRNNEANKVVRTDGNGYIQAGWINTTSGAFSSAIDRIYCSDDGYIRYQTPANFISNLGLITTSSIGSQSVSYASSAGYASEAQWITFNDGPRDLSDRRPNWNNRSVAWDFVTAGTVGGSGNYAGVMTFSPWDGTTASTGDSSYQLAFANVTGVNASGIPGLRLRNGIDATWNSWYTIWHSGNDGAGSGLDSDYLDGQQGSYYTDAGNLTGTIGDVFASTTRYNIGLIDGNGSQSRDKIRVWDSSEYTIGMKSGYTYGWLGKGTDGYAMSFQMSNTTGRGFWWGDSGHNDAQGAMSLTTDGKATIATSLTIGEGESITSPSSTTLYVRGNTAGARVFEVYGTQGQLFSITDDLTGSIFSASDISGIPILDVDASGVVTIDDTLNVYGDVTAYYSSDERLKDNVTPITNAIDKMKLIGGYEFDWNNLSKHEGHDVGVIAQEIEKVLPEVVTTRSNGYKAVKYEKLAALLIQANKELIERVEELEKKIK
jgi:predicted  nucleic acid-binding Zn-ribbon protein